MYDQTKVQTPRRRGRTVAFVVGLALLACCVGSTTAAVVGAALLQDDNSSDATAANAASGNGLAADESPDVPTLNQPVRDGKFEFVVTSVSCGHKSVGVGPVSAKAKGRFCLVDLSVENVGSSGQLLLDSVQRGFDSEGESYTPDSGAGVIANAGLSILISTIDPGRKVTGTIVFDVPNEVEITKLELHDSAFSRGATVTLA